MNKYTRLGKNTITVFIGNAGAKLIGLLMLPFYTRWLSVEDYGTTDIIVVYSGFLMGLVTACIADAVFVFPKDKPFEDQKSYFSSGLSFALCLLSLTAFLFKAVTLVFQNDDISNSFINNIWLVYALLTTNFLQQYMQQFARSINKIKVYSTTGIITTASTALFSFLIIPKWSVFGYVLALILANFVGMVYCFFCSSVYRYISVKAITKSTCKKMLHYSVPLIPNSLMWWLVGALNRPLMEKYLGMHSVGLFAVANKFPAILSMTFSIFSVSWQISVLEEFEKDEYEYFYNKIFRYMMTGLLLLFLIITIFSKLIVRMFAASYFYEAWKYIPLLSLGVIFLSISGFSGSNFSASRESKYFFYSSIWTIISSIILNFILIPIFGIMGAAISVLISYMIMAISRILYGWKYVKIKNIALYVLMLSIAVLAIIVMLYVSIFLVKNILIAFLFTVFLFLNYDLKNDIVMFYRKLKKI